MVFDVGLEVEEVHDHGHQRDHPRVHRGHDPGAPAALPGIVFGKVLIVILICQNTHTLQYMLHAHAQG